MLTVNTDVCDGFVNESRGEVVHVVSLGERYPRYWSTMTTLTTGVRSRGLGWGAVAPHLVS